MRIFTRKPPWYTAGLAFECLGCGQCCAGPGQGYVWVTQQDIADIADHLGIPIAEMRGRYVRQVGSRMSLIERRSNKDCVFLAAEAPGGGTGRTRSCTIYPVRPAQCRTWPFWSANLRSPWAWSLAATRCPGINRGQVFSCDEIEAKCNAARL